jgi:hypothetical protein
LDKIKGMNGNPVNNVAAQIRAQQALRPRARSRPRRRWTFDKDVPGASALRQGFSDMMERTEGSIAQNSLRDDIETTREQHEISKRFIEDDANERWAKKRRISDNTTESLTDMGVDKTLVDFADFAFRAGDSAREGLPWNYPYDAVRKTMLTTKDNTLDAAHALTQFVDYVGLGSGRQANHTLTQFVDYVGLNGAAQVQQGAGKCAHYVD